MEEKKPTVLVKVSSRSISSKVAGAIAGLVRDGNDIDVQSIGASATYIAVESIITAMRYLEEDELRVYIFPKFVYPEKDSQVVGIKFEMTSLRKLSPLLNVPLS